jgi:hypothetical protein
MKFPKGWVIGTTKICQICFRECIEKKEIEYEGLVGSQECSVCHRNVCELHTTEIKENIRVCTDCFIYVNPKETKSTHSNSST